MTKMLLRQPLKRSGAVMFAMLCASTTFMSSTALAEIINYRGKSIDIALPGEVIANEVVVVAETSAAKRNLGSLAAKLGGSVTRDIVVAGMQAWRMVDDTAAKRVIAKINGMPGFHAYANPKMSVPPPPEVLPELRARALRKAGIKETLPSSKKLEADGHKAPEQAAPDTMKPQWSSNDVSVSNQWALWRVNEVLTFAPVTGVKGIAIIDTGVDYRHPDLAGKVVSVWDYVDNDKDAMDAYGHGTHCAGIAAAKAGNTAGIRGISPNSIIYAYRVLDQSGSGSFTDIIAAIYAAADKKEVNILSLSLGGYVIENSYAYSDIKASVDYAVNKKGKILVSAAGNEYNDDLYYYQNYGYNYRVVPGWIPTSFTVAATTETDSRAYFSNYDITRASPNGLTTYNWNFVDIAAPGTNILSTTPNDGYERWSGTSMATPLVAGAAARLWDMVPTWTAAQVQARLVNSGQLLCAGSGFPVCERRLDMHRALGGSVAGGFIGRILHGESGDPLDGVKVEALAGSTVAATALTTRAGYYVFPSLASYASGYALRLSKTGYVTRLSPSQGDRPAGSLKSVGDQLIVPSRPTTATDENWRIVVSWPHTNPGLDIYNAGYIYGGFSSYFPFNSYHASGLMANAFLKTPSGTTIYFGYTGSLTSSPYAKFMYDAWNGLPMEAHVIRDKSAGTYSYWVSVNPTNGAWGSIKYGLGGTANPSYPSYPYVEVYKGDTLVKTIKSSNATRVGTGTKYWNVLQLTDNATNPVTVINQITDVEP